MAQGTAVDTGRLMSVGIMSILTFMPCEYICEMCGGKFVKGWTDEEANAEAQELFGEIPEIEKAIVCDDCFNKLRISIN